MANEQKYNLLVKNTLLFAISNFSSKFLSIFIRVYLSYAFASPDVMGVSTMMQQVANLLIPVVSLGVSYAVIRFGLDKEKDKAGVYMGGAASIASGFLILLIAMPLVRLIPNAAEYLLLLYLCVLMSCLRTLGTQFIRSRMLNRLAAIDGVLTTATLFGFYLLFLNGLGLGARGYLLAMFCSDAVSAVFVFVAGGCRQYCKPSHFDRALWWEMLRYSIPMIPAAISFWVINASDMFFVQAMAEGYQGHSAEYWVGLLSAGYFLPQVITVIGTTFFEAWQLSAVTEEEERAAFFTRVFRIYTSVLFCCVAGVVLLCRPVMLLYRADYYEAWRMVPFLAFSSMCTCLNQFLNSVFMVYKRSTFSLYTMLTGAILNLILNYFFILLFGPWGVTPASFISLLVVFLLRARGSRGLIEISFHPRRLLVNLALVLAEIWLLMNLTFWVPAVLAMTAGIIALNFREVWQMAEQLLHMLLGRLRRRKS